MERSPVSSSNLASVGYDESSKTLEIQFHSGGIYQYYAVPFNVYNALINASSKGTYFDQFIKKGGYRFRKIR